MGGRAAHCLVARGGPNGPRGGGSRSSNTGAHSSYSAASAERVEWVAVLRWVGRYLHEETLRMRARERVAAVIESDTRVVMATRSARWWPTRHSAPTQAGRCAP